MKVTYDKEGNRFVNCNCGRVSMAVRWSISDKLLEKVLNRFVMCPSCRDNLEVKIEKRRKHDRGPN